ncbi:MAG: hypothetical protein ACFE8E_05600 [Candidatus Hodarchaeota archaeon]
MSVEPKHARIQVYFDCICGIICSSLSISGLIITTILRRIFNPYLYALSLTFWIIWLVFSIFLIVLGMHTKRKEEEALKRVFGKS